MFGVFQSGSATNKSSLPQIQDLVLVFETPADLNISGSNGVEGLRNSAPYFTNLFGMTDNGTPGTYIADTGGPSDQNTMFGLVNQPAWRMSNSANGYFRMSGSITGGVTPDGFTVFTVSRANVKDADFGWQLTPAGSGDAINFYYTSWNDGGTPRPRFQITTSTGTTITQDQTGYSNGNDFRRYHCFATDFAAGATGAEYQYTAGLKTITGGGTMDTTVQTLSPNNPDTNYSFSLGSVFNRPSVDFQVIYVWKVKLTSAEISQVVDYVNNFYIPTI